MFARRPALLMGFHAVFTAGNMRERPAAAPVPPDAGRKGRHTRPWVREGQGHQRH